MRLIRNSRFFLSCGGAGLVVFFLLGVTMSSPARAVISANVQVNAGNVRSVMSPMGLGLHTSQYYGNLGHQFVDDRLEEAGVTTLRYGGGGYADVYHWSVHQASPFWGDPNQAATIKPGTDFASFVTLLDQVDNGQTVVTVNYGSAMKIVGNQSVVPDFGGQAKEAAAWVAYANADPSIYGSPNDVVIGVDQQGNDWKTAGYWARLRVSTPTEYQSWATDDEVYDAHNLFLAIDRDAPVGVEYWEIGNETFGTGYYGGGNGYSVDYDVPYDGTNRNNNTELSPTQYGQEVVEYSQLMKSIDPSIKIGAVLSTPPDDSFGVDWDSDVLAEAAGDIDFVVSHWYPFAGNNANGNSLLSQVRTKLPRMINGTTSGQDTGSNAGLRDKLAAFGIPNAEIMITEFNYMGSLNPTYESAAESVFVADAYASWLDLGVTSVDYLELLGKDFLDDSPNLIPGSAYYGVRMVHELVSPGESLVGTSSDNNDVRVHAALKADGSLAIMIVNANLNNVADVTIDVEGILLESGAPSGFSLTDGTSFRRAPSTNVLDNQLSLSVPQRSILTYIIPAVAGTAGDFDGDGDVDGDDLLKWQRDGLSQDDLMDWENNYGTGPPPLSASVAVPEPTSLALATSVILACLLRKPRRW